MRMRSLVIMMLCSVSDAHEVCLPSSKMSLPPASLAFSPRGGDSALEGSTFVRQGSSSAGSGLRVLAKADRHAI